MNMNQIFNMFQRLVIRRLMSGGISKGIDLMARRNDGPGADGKLNDKGRQTRKQARAMTKRARQVQRILRWMK